MSQNQIFQNSLNTVKKQIRSFIDKAQENMTEEISKLIAYTFRDVARNRLIRSNNAISQQQSVIERVSKSIMVRKYKSGYKIVLSSQTDPEGLLMFLEFGTGLVGKAKPHSWAKSIGWKYAINENEKSKQNPDLPHYVTRSNGKRGWFWRPQGDITKYIDKDDMVENYKRTYNAYRLKPEHPKYGSTTKFWETHRLTGNPRLVFSSGIKPLRFLYRTRLDIVKAINRANGDINKLKQELQILRSAI